MARLKQSIAIFVTLYWSLVFSGMAGVRGFPTFHHSGIRRSLARVEFVENDADWEQSISTTPYALVSSPPVRSRRTQQVMLLSTASQLAELLHGMKFKNQQPQQEQLLRSYYKQQDDQQRQINFYQHQQSSGKDSVGVLTLKSLRIGRR